MTALLTFLQCDRVTLDEINGPWTWMLVNEYAINEDAASEQLVAAMIADPSFTALSIWTDLTCRLASRTWT